jgi:hypothetical protein
MFFRRFLPATGNLFTNNSIPQCLTAFFKEFYRLIIFFLRKQISK